MAVSRICKKCGKEFYGNRHLGLWNFCSEECKNEYRRKYKTQHKRSERGKINIDNDSLKPPYKIYTFDIDLKNNAYDMVDIKLTDKREAMVFDKEYSSQANFNIAKKCCNWEFKQKAGYCVMLSHPYRAFVSNCKECKYFQLLANNIIAKQEKRQKQNTRVK